ncbi:MAG: c-type cytochrome [Hyphomicrobiales bacterium]|nr:c-type cytochrome [Hyphomicrobiales bacterium]
MRLAVVTPLAMLALAGCQREERSLRLDPPVEAGLNDVRVMSNGIGGAPPKVYIALGRPYENNAYDLDEGKRLYDGFGCTGCHAHGGGNTGPAFLDGWWQYGADPVSIFVSIRDGRSAGMPAFGRYLTTEQIWQLTGYVQTIGAYSAKTAAPSRNDEMQSRPSENRAPATLGALQPPSR